MASDWWSRKLNGSQTQPTQRTSLPTTTPPIRIGVQVPQQPQPQQQQPAPRQQVLDESRAPNEEIRMGDAIRMWRGGEAARKEGDMYCPDCGSQHVFSRVAKGNNTMVQGKAPAPRCFECGWTGLYTQGSESKWV